MVFSSPIFLFAFLPLALAAYFATPRRFRNAVLLTVSLFFYVWGEPRYPWVLPASIAGNFAAGLALARTESPRRRRWLLTTAVIANLGLLVAFKYTCFLAETVNPLMTWAGLRPFRLIPPHLPLGVSFFTFQAIAYVADVARRDVPAERRPVRFGLAAALFPHLIAGPIVRYRDLAGQLGDRRVPLEDFAAGVRRITAGLAKKVLLANTLAWAADQAFHRPPAELGVGAAWLGLVCYALQIYFDFSGYSDMAIGLGRLFGFTFPENFRHPYAAESVTAFWRRWHMSLSSWLRDYLYIPLGGGRRRATFNVLVVFAACGLWHGAAWTFVVWGLWHGAFLVIERSGAVSTFARPLRHAWTLLAVLGGWVLFRADSLAHAAGYFAALAGAGRGVRAADLLAGDVALALAVGVPACLPVLDWLRGWWAELPRSAVRDWVGAAAEVAVCGGLLFAVTVDLAGGSYNPFLYFRF
ncbi:MAG TPA: MBOAT family O-acyltransferase [Gemmataceae bacterium]|jgi:alginate O-acetyltransferase complex protein AlgI